MTEKGAETQDRQLWRQFRALAGSASRAPEPDALSLAAYAEGRLNEAAAEAIETWLVADPARISDVVAARSAMQRPPQLTYQTVVANACGLIPGDGEAPAEVPAAGKVVPLRRPAPPWRSALAWSGIAASLLCASFAGFSMGSVAYAKLSPAQSDFLATDSLDTPATLGTFFSDDPGT
jgi:anti-sigma factor RsiW